MLPWSLALTGVWKAEAGRLAAAQASLGKDEPPLLPLDAAHAAAVALPAALLLGPPFRGPHVGSRLKLVGVGGLFKDHLFEDALQATAAKKA